VTAVVRGAVYWSRAAPPGQAMRLTVAFGDDVRHSIGEDFVRSGSISPDGERLVFTGVDAAAGIPRLYIRPIASDTSTPLAGSDYGTEPFWSPNSRSIGFYAGGKVMITSVDGPPRATLPLPRLPGARVGTTGTRF
jgi:hypothetical protein